MTEHVLSLFVYPLPESDWPKDPADEEDVKRLGEKFIGELPDRFSIDSTAWGAGASQFALAVEVVVTATIYAGAIVDWVQLSQVAGRVWRRIRKKAVLALNGARMLCVEDLGDRLSDLKGVTFGWAGQTPGKEFMVTFRKDDTFWLYVLDEKGVIRHYGKGDSLSHPRMESRREEP